MNPYPWAWDDDIITPPNTKSTNTKQQITAS